MGEPAWKPRSGAQTGGRYVRPCSSTAAPIQNRSYLKALRAAEMATWQEPPSTNAAADAAHRQIGRARRMPRNNWAPWIETALMVGLFGFTVVGLAYRIALGSSGDLVGLGEFVKSALR